MIVRRPWKKRGKAEVQRRRGDPPKTSHVVRTRPRKTWWTRPTSANGPKRCCKKQTCRRPPVRAKQKESQADERRMRKQEVVEMRKDNDGRRKTRHGR